MYTKKVVCEDSESIWNESSDPSDLELGCSQPSYFIGFSFLIFKVEQPF